MTIRTLIEDKCVASLFQLTDADGQPLGSAFAIAGGLLTCAHVVGDRPAGILFVRDGSELRAVTSVVISTTRDAALLRVEVPLTPLAITTRRPDHLLIGGFPEDAGLVGAFWTHTVIDGTTAIRYDAGERSFELDQVWALPTGFLMPGNSGGPVIDLASGAVAGLLVADFLATGKSGLNGFALPIETLLNDPDIGPQLEAARALIPCYGPAPNAVGALDWSRRTLLKELAQMQEERRFDPAHAIPRVALQERVERFLAGPAQALILNDRAGLGKTTALADLASRIVDRPVLLLRALELDGPLTTLSALIAKKLGAAAPAHVRDTCDLSAIVVASDVRPLVIIDGLNEARLSDWDMGERWLPAAVRSAAGCKLILSCRSEHWQHIGGRLPRSLTEQPDEDAPADAGPLGIGEFSDAEQRDFLARRFEVPPAFATELHDPMLLGLVADLQDELPDRRIGRWLLMSRAIERDCRRAAARSATSARQIEDLLERVARSCLERGEATLPRSDSLTRETGFDDLLAEHLLIAQAGGYGFRHDLLFEHLAARTLRLSELSLVDDGWREGVTSISWPIALSACERATAEGASDTVDALWEQLLKGPASRNFYLVRCIAALPFAPGRAASVMRQFEAVAAHGPYQFMFAASNLADADWPAAFALDVLKLHVLSCSGYDFRENDLSSRPRFMRDAAQFDLQGFRIRLIRLLDRDRPSVLRALGEWHRDRELLGIINRDNTRESSVSSWTSCCFVFASDLLSDEELRNVPDPQYCGAVFHGLALQDSNRLVLLARQLAAAVPLDANRLRKALRAINHMSDELEPAEFADDFRRTACEIGLDQFAKFRNADFENDLIEWSAAHPKHRNRAWGHLILLAKKGRATSAALRAFMPYQPDAVEALAEQFPTGFTTWYGSILLDLARPPILRRERVLEWVHERRVTLLRRAIAQQGHISKDASDTIDLVLNELDADVSRRLGLAQLALEAIASGEGGREIVYFAGDQNANWSGDKLALADELAVGFAETSPLRESVEQVLWMRLTRAVNAGDPHHDLALLPRLARIAAARFGSELLADALHGAVLLFALASAERKAAILDAYSDGSEDPQLATAIARIGEFGASSDE